MSVYDLDGPRVVTIYHEDLRAGTHQFGWRGRRADGSATRSSLYFVRATVACQILTRRAVLVEGR